MPALTGRADSRQRHIAFMRNAFFEAAGLQVFERGWLSSNNILFVGDEAHGSVLVDSGYCTHAPQTLALVRHALGPKRLDRIVNTHLHSDHCGGNHVLQSAFACSIDVPAGEAHKVDRWDEAALSFRATGQQCPRFARTGVIGSDSEIECGPRRWQVIAAPGHDPESIVLYQPELQVLISADALWENGFGVVFPELEGAHAFDAVRSTLDRLARLPVQWVIPGHGAPFKDIQQAIDRAHSRLDRFVAHPAHHARHAAKVLIKFHLLEVQQRSLTALIEWLESTTYVRLSHAAHFEHEPIRDWCLALLEELAASRAICIREGLVMNT
jgi:glyoxylase-like metal-dependent hydrolase (beta-lactamase superfamily II)